MSDVSYDMPEPSAPPAMPEPSAPPATSTPPPFSPEYKEPSNWRNMVALGMNLAYFPSKLVLYIFEHFFDFIIWVLPVFWIWIALQLNMNKDQDEWKREMRNTMFIVVLFLILCVLVLYPSHVVQGSAFSKGVEYHKQDFINRVDEMLVDKMMRLENVHNTMWTNINSKMKDFDANISAKFAHQLAAKI